MPRESHRFTPGIDVETEAGGIVVLTVTNDEEDDPRHRFPSVRIPAHMVPMVCQWLRDARNEAMTEDEVS